MALGAALCGAATLAWPAAAMAESAALRQRAREMSDEAAKLFKAQRYAEAAERIEQAYALDPSVRLRLRNAGRAWQEAGNAARALHCFERFLALETDPALRKDAEERIAALRQSGGGQVAAGRASAGSVASPRSPPQGGAPGAADAGATPATREAVPAPDLSTSAPAPSRALPVAVAGAGVGLLATGIAWHLQTAGAAAKVDDGEQGGHYAYPGGSAKLERDRQTLVTNRAVGWSLVGAGAIGAGVGAWLWLRAPRAGADVAVLPVLARDGAGFAVSARF